MDKSISERIEGVSTLGFQIGNTLETAQNIMNKGAARLVEWLEEKSIMRTPQRGGQRGSSPFPLMSSRSLALCEGGAFV